MSRGSIHRAAAVGVLLASAVSAQAGAIVQDQFLQFAFEGAGSTATGCDPADPAGPFCLGSSGTVTGFLDAPAWTFTAGAGGATLTVVDAFESGDEFDLFDFGLLIGSTSSTANQPPADCGDDPVVCLATPGMSLGVFTLAAGNHSLTLVATQSPQGLGSGYLQVSGAAAVPLPASLTLVFGGLLAGWATRRRPLQATTGSAA